MKKHNIRTNWIQLDPFISSHWNIRFTRDWNRMGFQRFAGRLFFRSGSIESKCIFSHLAMVSWFFASQWCHFFCCTRSMLKHANAFARTTRQPFTISFDFKNCNCCFCHRFRRWRTCSRFIFVVQLQHLLQKWSSRKTDIAFAFKVNRFLIESFMSNDWRWHRMQLSAKDSQDVKNVSENWERKKHGEIV